MKEFNKVFGYKNEKIELERIADMMLNPKKYQKLGVKTTRGLLLTGEPGVGKTLMANCLIKASKRKAFTIRKNIPDGDFVKALKNTLLYLLVIINKLTIYMLKIIWIQHSHIISTFPKGF